MNFTVLQAGYYVGAETVNITCANPLGGLTIVTTTQTELDAARTDTSKPWSDAELETVALAKLVAEFPAVAGLTVSLYVAP